MLFLVDYKLMILSYNWQILESGVKDEQELKEMRLKYQPKPADSFSNEEQQKSEKNLQISPITLKCPNFGFLFCYYIEEPKVSPPEIQLTPQITLLDEAVRFKTVKNVQMKNCIYLQIEIENSEIYDNLLTLAVKIRYHTENKLPKIGSIQQLVRMAGQRQINLYTATTYATIKRELILESPVLVQWRQEREGYLYLKLLRSEQWEQSVEILQIQIMNWLSVRQQTRGWLVNNLVKKVFRLSARQSYAVLFSCEGSLSGQQVPFYIIYRLPPSKQKYKMVKYLRLFQQK